MCLSLIIGDCAAAASLRDWERWSEEALCVSFLSLNSEEFVEKKVAAIIKSLDRLIECLLGVALRVAVIFSSYSFVLSHFLSFCTDFSGVNVARR